MSVTSVRLQADVEKPLEELSKRLDRSKNYLINQAIREYVARQALEDARWEETLQALASIQAGRSIPEEEVNAWLESWGTDGEIPAPKP